MRMTKSGQITIPKELRDRFGLDPNTPLELEVGVKGILIKTRSSHRRQVSRWIKDEHGSEMVTLTTDQIMQLIR